MGDARFCPNCGAGVDGPAAPVMDVRQRSINEMENMRAYFGVKAAEYDALDAVTAEVNERSAKSFAGYIIGAVISVIIALFGAAFFWVVAVLCVAGFILFKKSNKDKLTAALARQAALTEELETYYKDYGYCPVGFEYTSPAMLEALYEMIRKGRASNPADAINLLLDDLRQEEMQKTLEETKKAAEETAKQSRKAARYSSANFWFK